MQDVYVFNPFVFIIENEENYLIRAGLEYEKKLDKRYFKQLIEKIINKETFKISELLLYFSEKEIVELFTKRILLDKEIDLESSDSRNRGYFSLLQNERYYDWLKKQKIFILGAGAIGSHVAWMLAAIGIKNLTILDYDLVELSNLNRQVLYEYGDVGKSKVKILKNRLISKFPEINIKFIERKINSEQDLREYIDSTYDILIRAIDSPIEVGNWVNKICCQLKIPYTSGGFIGDKGVVGPSYVPLITPCLDCYEHEIEIDNIIYGTAGTLAPLTELVSSKIVYEVLRIISKETIIYNGIMEIIDPYNNISEFSKLATKRTCKSCLSSREEKITLENGKGQLLYFLCLPLIPFIVTIAKLPMVTTFISIFIITFILACSTFLEKDVYEKSFYGGVLFAVSSLMITAITNPNIFSLNQSVIFLIANLCLQILTTITLSISLFELIAFLILKVRNLIFRFKKIGGYENVDFS
ncbi:TPA: ThiF family adenylyltransferase [Enterococcus faecalis]